MIRKLLPFMKKYRWYALLCPLLMILEVISDILIPYLMSLVVDVGIKQGDTPYILKLGLAMIFLALAGMVMGIVSSRLGATAGYGLAAEIRQAAYDKVQGFSFTNLDAMSVPSLITRITSDCDTLGMVTMMSLRMAIRAPFMMIFALIMTFRVNPQLARIFLVAIPIVVIAMFLILKTARPLFTLLQKKVDGINAIVQENLIGIRVVKSFNRQSFEASRFKVKNDDLQNTALRAISVVVLLMPILNTVIYLCIIAVLWFGGLQVMAGTLEGGSLIAFVTYVIQIMISLMMLSMYFMQLTRGQASAGRLVEVLETDSEIRESDDPIHTIENGSIEFKGVCFRYPGNAADILKNIDLRINSGETIGIIGSTGSSKSTLVQMIPRLYDVSGGEVLVAGHSVKDYSLRSLRDAVAFVLQKNTLVTGTIRSNMLWGDDKASDEKIITKLKQAQAWEFVTQFPDGLDHPVAQGGSNFSGGQKQRLTIARALMKEPKIIILDDSTSAVDTATDEKLRRSFRMDLPGVTKLIIAQRVSSIEDADRIIVMDKGRIESMGTHDQLLERSAVYNEILQSQQRGLAV